MQTVNFSCGHCGKLMAVGVGSLGMQVRCPHCQQVVVAPTSHPNSGGSNIPAPDTSSHTPESSPHTTHPPLESFSDSFNDYQEPDLVPLNNSGESGWSGTSSSESPYESRESADDSSGYSVASSSTGTEDLEDPLATASENNGSRSLATRRKSANSQQANNWFLWGLVLPLISYAILSTILLAIVFNMYRNAANSNDRLFNLPDEAGDNPGIKKGKTAYRWEINPRIYTDPIPEKYIASLGKGQPGPTLHLGDLDVTPVKIEQKVVDVHVKGFTRAEPCNYPSLVLTLRLRNNANDYSFVPLDNYFDRHFTRPTEDDPYAPLTQIEIGSKRFAGGPAHWEPVANNLNKAGARRREWIDGRPNVEEYLTPGHEIETFVCTDGNNEDLAKSVKSHQGTFLWRVHLRRGLTTYKGKDISRTAVVGIQFSKDAISGLIP